MYVVGSVFRVLAASLVILGYSSRDARAVNRVEVEGGETLGFNENTGLTNLYRQAEE